MRQAIAFALLVIFGVCPVMTARCVAECTQMAAMQAVRSQHHAVMPEMEHCSMAMAEPDGDVMSSPMQCAHAMQHPSVLPAVHEERMDVTPLVVLQRLDVSQVVVVSVLYRADEMKVVHAPPPLERTSLLRI